MALLLTAVASVAGAFAPATLAAEGDPEKPRLKWYADVRLRSESDRDSTDPAGVEREDRDRLRARLRVGFTFAYDDHVTFGARVRTGNPLDQQSPHQSFGDEFESKPFNIDKAFVHGAWKRGWVWGGKNSFPFWMQNELFWDEDVNPEGVAAGSSFSLGEGSLRLRPTVGYFLIEASGSSNRYGDKSHFTGAQLALDAPFDALDISTAVGYYSFDDNPDTVDVALADMNYGIWVASAKFGFKRGTPWSVGFDYMKNTEDYDALVFNRDQDTGYVGSVSFGQLRQKGNWLVGYYYAHIEKFAVVARFAQDDWLRWGNASPPDTRSSNFEGHELRLAYAFGPAFNLMLRLYSVEGIELETPAAVTLEDGKRARLDLNIAF